MAPSIQVVKSPNDPKGYLAFELENGLKVLLVNDLECDKAAASISVGAGSMNDPEDIPGLAHLCEHLLSIEPSSSNGKPFNTFIAERGGMFNAFTARDQTNFHFDVQSSAFIDAFARFAAFFTESPKLSAQDVDREIAIVDAENTSKIRKDAWRKMAIDASTSRADHPFRYFSTGNKATLSETPKKKGINVLEAAVKFRATYYVSNIMTLVVYAKEPLDILRNLCFQLFSKMKSNEGLSLPTWEESPFGPKELRKRIDIVALSDIRDLFLVFPLANMRPFYKTFPHGYLTRVIGHRGPGSLYSHLSDLQWVETSYMNASVPARGFGELSIGFQLTKLGLKHVEEIVSLSFQYMNMVKDMGPQEEYWKEMRKVMYLKFLNQDKEVAIDFVQRISNLLHVYPMEDILTVGCIVSDFNPSLLQKYLNYLDPENCRIVTVCKANGEVEGKFETDDWYGAQYMIRELSDEQIDKWKVLAPSGLFSFPEPNKFIPLNFDIIHKPNNIRKGRLAWSPVLLTDTSLCKAWFLPDEEFQLAKGVIKVEISSPFSVVDPVSYNLNQILFLMLKSLFSDTFYQATIAGLYHGVKPTLYGVEITVSGFSDKLLILLEEIIKSIASIQESNESKLANQFNTAKDRYASSLVNLVNLTPTSITNHYLSLILREKRFSYDELLEAIPDTNMEALMAYIRCFFFRSYYQWMIYGNFARKDAQSLIANCTQAIQEKFTNRGVVGSQILRYREVNLTPGIEFIFEKGLPIPGNCCATLIQLGVLSMKESLLLEIVDQIIFEPLFTTLRSQEQIGYIVRSSVRKSNGSQGLLIFVQGDKDPTTISKRIAAVLENIESNLLKMTSNEFSQHKSAVRVRKADKPKSMLMLFNRIWNNEIVTRQYNFNRIETELEMLEKISKQEVEQFYKRSISGTSTSRKLLHVHLHKDNNSTQDPTVRQKTLAPNSLLITDINKWKVTMPLYPIN